LRLRSEKRLIQDYTNYNDYTFLISTPAATTSKQQNMSKTNSPLKMKPSKIDFSDWTMCTVNERLYAAYKYKTMRWWIVW